jgi:hypothetical protein
VSVKALSAVFEDSRARDAAFVVLLAMADWADQNGWCYPSYGQLAGKARVSRSTAKRAVAELIALGEIERISHGKPKDSQDEEVSLTVRVQARNLYRIALLKPRAAVGSPPAHLQAPANVGEVGPPSAHQVSSPAAEVGSSCATGGVTEGVEVGSSATLHIRIRPSGRPSVRPSDVQAGASPRLNEKTADENDPEKNLNVITKIAHETYDLLGAKADVADITDAVKSRCARLGVAYWPGDVVRRAVDSARWQREHRSSEVS